VYKNKEIASIVNIYHN